LYVDGVKVIGELALSKSSFIMFIDIQKMKTASKQLVLSQFHFHLVDAQS